MKKLIVFLAIVLFASFSYAATAEWTHDGANVDGFTVYFWETSAPETIYNKSVVGADRRDMVIPDDHFKPNVEYTFEATAWSRLGGESVRSNSATWIRDLPVYDPPTDSLPTTIIINTPGPVTINIP